MSISNGYNPKLLKWRRNKLRLSLRKAAKRTGVSKTTISRAEAGGELGTGTLDCIIENYQLDRAYVHDRSLRKKDFEIAVLGKQ